MATWNVGQGGDAPHDFETLLREESDSEEDDEVDSADLKGYRDVELEESSDYNVEEFLEEGYLLKASELENLKLDTEYIKLPNCTKKHSRDLKTKGKYNKMAFRMKGLLLHGLPEQKDEDHVVQALTALTEKMKIGNITSSDIRACHRLGVSSGKPRPLLIRFQHHSLRSEVWRNKTELNGSGLEFSEFLTKPRHDTFLEARKHFGVRQCWTSEGKIIILLPDKSRRKIETIAELRPLVTQFPMAKMTTDEPIKGGVSQVVGKSALGKRSRKLAK